MPRLLPALALAATLALSACGGDDEQQGAAPQTQPPAQQQPERAPAETGGGQDAVMAAEVDIDQFKYDPAEVTVKAGGTVTFTNREQAPHTATAEENQPAQFDTDRLEQGDAKKVAFEQPGTYKYFCTFHAFMRASVTVTE